MTLRVLQQMTCVHGTEEERMSISILILWHYITPPGLKNSQGK